MKRVIISQRIDKWPQRAETRDALDQRLINFVSQSGGFPVPVPNVLFKTLQLKQWLTELRPNAVILSGGEDIGTNNDRDGTETIILEYAKNNNLPLLGICRGMQFMANHAGVSLKEVAGHIKTNHHLIGEIRGTANSFHQFSLEKCPLDYKCLSRSEDKEIEAISHRQLPWEGWMWHPERLETFEQRDLNRFSNLLKGK